MLTDFFLKSFSICILNACKRQTGCFTESIFFSFCYMLLSELFLKIFFFSLKIVLRAAIGLH